MDNIKSEKAKEILKHSYKGVLINVEDAIAAVKAAEEENEISYHLRRLNATVAGLVSMVAISLPKDRLDSGNKLLNELYNVINEIKTK